MDREYFRHVLDAITEFVDFVGIIDWGSVALIFGIFILIIFVFVGRDVFYRNSLICKHFNDHIQIGDYIRDQFYLAVRRESLRKYDKYDYDYADKEIELYDYFDSIVFFHDENQGGSFVHMAPEFCDFVMRYHPDYTLSDFSSAVIKYRRFYEHRLRQQREQARFEQSEIFARTNDIKSAICDLRCHRQMSVYEQIKGSISDIDISNSYQKVFDDIKSHDYRGLMPKVPVKNEHLRSFLYKAVILPHDRIHDVSLKLPNVPAICICYNTYNDKYYIVNTDKLSDFLKDLFVFDESDSDFYDNEFKADIYVGHKILVKILLMNQLGSIDSNRLREYLVSCYDSVYPNGYNCRKIS